MKICSAAHREESVGPKESTQTVLFTRFFCSINTSLYASALARGEKSVIQLVVYKYFERFPSTDLSAGSSGFVEECPVKKNRKAVLEETKKKNEWKCKWCERFRFKKIDLVSGVFVSIGIV